MNLVTASSAPCFISTLLVTMFLAIGSARAAANETPRLFLLEPKQLVEVKTRIKSQDAALLPAFNKLIREANRALTSGTPSVVQKELTPPSGDQHDYVSIAPYWWPNPNTSTGLPYVRRDGEVNPERDQTSDRKRLDGTVQAVKTLSIGYFLTGREEYAAQATKLLRVWFLEPATKMNPNLTYAQAIPGRTNGRGSGIIETHNLPELIDAVAMLNGSKNWDQSQQEALQDWFNAYLLWLLESPEGRTEAKAQNNHGSWYDVQVASYALFSGKNELAKKVLSEFPTKRISQQIEQDGRQPNELKRTRAWSYSLFNLEALFNAASIADKLGMDFWNYEAPDKRGIRKALDWLVPFTIGERQWSYPQISARQPEKLAPFLRRAARQYREISYENTLSKLPGATSDQRFNLLWPTPVNADPSSSKNNTFPSTVGGEIRVIGGDFSSTTLEPRRP
jgi:Alginate lyase